MTTVQIATAILGLLAGIGIFLVACSMLSRNLETAGSSKLRQLFAGASKSKPLGVGIGTLTAAIAVPIALSILHRNVLLGIIVFIGPVIMFIKHRDNFKRIKEGTEIGFIRARKGEGRVK